MKKDKLIHEDIVTLWLTENKLTAPELKYTLYLNFIDEIILVKCSSRIKLDMIKYRLKPYVIEKIISQESNININIYSYHDFPDIKSIVLPAVIESNKRIQENTLNILRSNEFYHLKNKSAEGIWRAVDLLASFPSDNNPYKVVNIVQLKSADYKEEINESSKFIKIGEEADTEELSQLLFLIYMRMKNIFCLHAALLCFNTTGIIITGSSGAGKTTTALSLIRDNFIFLTDEITLLFSEKGSIKTSGIMLKPRLHNNINNNLDTLEKSLSGKKRGSKTDIILSDKIISMGFKKTVKPEIIIFLNDEKTERHSFEVISKQQAFINLLGHVVDPTNVTRHERQFEMLTGLVEKCRCFSLTLGRNLKSLPGKIRKLAELND